MNYAPLSTVQQMRSSLQSAGFRLEAFELATAGGGSMDRVWDALDRTASQMTSYVRLPGYVRAYAQLGHALVRGGRLGAICLYYWRARKPS